MRVIYHAMIRFILLGASFAFLNYLIPDGPPKRSVQFVFSVWFLSGVLDSIKQVVQSFQEISLVSIFR